MREGVGAFQQPHSGMGRCEMYGMGGKGAQAVGTPFPPPPPLQGPPGTGKTHTVLGILNSWHLVQVRWGEGWAKQGEGGGLQTVLGFLPHLGSDGRHPDTPFQLQPFPQPLSITPHLSTGGTRKDGGPRQPRRCKEPPSARRNTALQPPRQQ